ncbi:MAG: hypothetical protein Q9212_004514 [Teloschistes hypoglaucus]
MSTDFLPLLRKNAGEEISALAEDHLKHDLHPADRDLLKSGTSKISTHVTIGSAVGLALGGFLAFRLRRTRTHMFNAFRAHEKPTHVKFADGREEAIPDLTPYMRPTALGDIATYTFVGLGGLFLGGQIGILTGAGSSQRLIARDPEAKKRIDTAFRKIRADVLRQEADTSDKRTSVTRPLGL